MEEWKEVRLGEFIEFHRGYDLTKASIINGPYPVVCSTSIMGYHNEYKIKGPGIVIGRSGTLGEVQYIETDFWPHNTSLYVSNFFGNDPKFVKYFLKIIGTGNVGGGSAVPTLNRNHLQSINVKVPPLPTQQKIAQILSSLDDKIELNNKINANLEQQAQALFKSWFVDFEPFDGEMPAGWKVGTLSDVAKLSAGGDKPEETSEKKNEVYNIPIYSNGLDNYGLYGFTNRATIFEESVTVSARGTIGFVCLRTTPYVPIVRLVSVIPKCTNVSAKYLYLSLRNKNIAGTGTTQQQLTVPAFSKEDILIPTEEDMTSFTNLVQPMFSKVFELRAENEKLATIRDTLLPKLMNGEIEI